MIKIRYSGLSLLELMLYIGLAAALIVGVVQLARLVTDRTKLATTNTIGQATKAAVDSFKLDIGRLPKSLDELINPPADSREKRVWKGPYVPSEYARTGEIVDAYGKPLEYKIINAAEFELFSWGKNEVGSDTGQVVF